jgi:hypothetical protein
MIRRSSPLEHGNTRRMASTLKDNLDGLQQKARERTVKTQNVEYDLETLRKRIDSGIIKLDPDYQRRHRWTKATSSRLIESLLLNIPIPVVFISQDIDVDAEAELSSARYTVIDGQQRLTAIYDFLTNKFALEDLETLAELNGSYFRDLPPFLLRRMDERTIKCLRIDSTVDEQVKFDIFERLNTGSVKLEPQELRNATARGPFNDMIKGLARNPDFMALIQVDHKNAEESPKVQKMEDVELVLRFFALSGGRYRQLRKGFKEFLTASLADFNERDEEVLREDANVFSTFMSFIRVRAGTDAFSKWRYDVEPPKRMSTFNAAVFDAVAVGLSEVYSADQIRQTPDVVADRLQGYREALFTDKEFFSSVSGSVNDSAKVSYRIQAMEAFLRR